MNIDFPPPLSGVYNNAGSSRQLANYLEHEDLERIEQGIYTEGFFNLTEDNLYKSQIIKDLDSNNGQLMKTDAKFYAIHVSPSAKELQQMGNTEEEQHTAMKKYIREVFIPEYAKNFNKGLNEADIKFYGKIHFDRNRSENKENNMHCHIAVSRKDQANRVKISPLTNHRNTKQGAVKGGFDRTQLFQNAEKGFDDLFGFHRQLSETFEYCNTMKNGSISEQLKMQEREMASKKENKLIGKGADMQIGSADVMSSLTHELSQSISNENIDQPSQSINMPDLGLLDMEQHGADYEAENFAKCKKREEKRRLRR